MIIWNVVDERRLINFRVYAMIKVSAKRAYCSQL
jgi:hypothetical protein